MTMTATTTPRVWVGCLACYNAARLVGAWVDATEAADFVPCRRPFHDEWWCFDHEGFGGILTGECSPAEAQRIAEALESVGEDNAEAFAAFVANDATHRDDLDAAALAFEDAYCGEWPSIEDYARELAGDIMPSAEAAQLAERWPFNCIDWAQAARELVIGGDNWTAAASGGGVHVFRNV